MYRYFQVNWLKNEGFAGWMVWTLDFDDFSGTFCNAGKYPLIKALKNALSGGRCVSPPIMYCHSSSSSCCSSSSSHFYVWSMFDDIRLRVSRSYTSFPDCPLRLSHCSPIFSAAIVPSFSFVLHSHRPSSSIVFLYWSLFE